MNMARLKVPLLVLLMLTLQSTLFSGLRNSGLHADTLLLLPITAGIVAGAESGALVGFLAGLTLDLFLQTPFGLSALAYSLVGFGVGTVQGNVIRAAWWIAPLTAIVASAAGIVVYGLVGAMVGQAQLLRGDLPVIAGWVAVVNAPLAVPVVKLMEWALKGRNTPAFAR
jgi:rod shape-determining protein MreD